MKAPLSYVPALPAAVGISAGVLADSLGVGGIVLVAAILAFIILYLRRLHYSALCALMVAAGAILAIAHRATPAPEFLFDGKHSYIATVDEVSENLTSISYIAEVTEIDDNKCRPFLTLVTANSVSNPVPPGCTVRFTARLLPIGYEEEIPHEGDYRKFLTARGITANCMLNGPLHQVAPATGMQAFANTVSDHIYNAIVDSPVDGKTAAFLVASILGDRRFISPDEFSTFRDTGVAHILALSGLHVGIIASMLAILLYPLRLWRRGISVAALLTMAFVWCYAVIAGLTPSILRAAVMITVMLSSRLIGRGANGYNSLSLAVVVILTIDPMSLFSPGFQLSVAAVITILMFGGLLPRSLRRYPVLYSASGLVLTSVSAMIGTGIVSAYYFNSFPALFIISNIITGFLFPLILGGGIVLAVLTAVGVNFGLLGAAVDAVHSLMQWSLSALGSVDGSVIRHAYFSAWVILPYAITVVMLALALHHRRRLWWILTGTMTVMTFVTAAVTRERVPATELYIPSSFSPSSVIMRSGNKAWIYTPVQNESGSVLDRANKRYRRFLLSRGCGESFIPVTDSLSDISLKIQDLTLLAVDRTIAVVGKQMPDIFHVDYALINSDFRGTIERVYRHLSPDTILLAPDIHPSRRAALIRQCGDSIPFRNLKQDHFSITW